MMSPYETKLRLRRLARRKPGGVHDVGDCLPEVDAPDGTFRFTVIFHDGLGQSLFLPVDDLQKIVGALPVAAQSLKIDPSKEQDICRGRNLIRDLFTSEKRADQQAAAMLGLFLSWNHPGASVPEHVKQAIHTHRKACLVLAIDWRLNYAATYVGKDYFDPFATIGDIVLAATPAGGQA